MFMWMGLLLLDEYDIKARSVDANVYSWNLLLTVPWTPKETHARMKTTTKEINKMSLTRLNSTMDSLQMLRVSHGIWVNGYRYTTFRFYLCIYQILSKRTNETDPPPTQKSYELSGTETITTSFQGDHFVHWKWIHGVCDLMSNVSLNTGLLVKFLPMLKNHLPSISYNYMMCLKIGIMTTSQSLFILIK